MKETSWLQLLQWSMNYNDDDNNDDQQQQWSTNHQQMITTTTMINKLLLRQQDDQHVGNIIKMTIMVTNEWTKTSANDFD